MSEPMQRGMPRKANRTMAPCVGRVSHTAEPTLRSKLGQGVSTHLCCHLDGLSLCMQQIDHPAVSSDAILDVDAYAGIPSLVRRIHFGDD